jgi:hypothetical protein
MEAGSLDPAASMNALTSIPASMPRIGPVMLACFLLAPSAGGNPASDQSGVRTVLFALQRSERLHAFDAETLQHLGHFVTGPLGDSLGARVDGRRLFLLQPSRDIRNSCCSLQTIDLATREMCWMSEPAVGTIEVSGGLVAAGGNVFNAQTLAPVPVPRGFYAAYPHKPSTDGGYSAKVDRGPVLVFTNTASLAQQTIPIPEEARAADWVGNHFMLLAAGPGKGQLWAVSPSDTALPAPREVTWPDADSRVGLSFVLGSDLVTYMRFGRSLMMDLRERGGAVPGGAIVIPSAGGAARRIAKEIYFTKLIPGGDGRSLYAVEAGPLEGPAKPVRLLRLDAQTGKVTTSIVLNDAALFPDAAFDVWSLALANVPENLVPRGQLRPVACTR